MNMKKMLAVVLAILLMVFTLAGCLEDETLSVPDLDAMNVSTDMPNLEQTLDVEGESFKLLCVYDTGVYKLSDWRITDSKTLSMKVKTVGLPAGTEVFIDHVHCDINIQSILAAINGLQQDSMDDTYHGPNQPGFYIDDSATYKNIFAIEGYSETLFSGWGYVAGSYGAYSVSQERLTEETLVVKGRSYAQKVQIVYDLSIKTADQKYYHTVSVVSEFLVPLNVKKYYEQAQDSATN